MERKEILARNIQHLMKLKGVTRNEMSDELAINYFTLTDWVQGRKFPRSDKLDLLAGYFGVTVAELVSGDEIQGVFDRAEFYNAMLYKSTLEKLTSLNESGREQLMQYLEFLLSNEKYRKE